MADPDIFETIAAWRAEGRPFCVATVVRTADATSAKAGAKAVVSAEGAIHGHLGGACLARAVARAAAEALAAGTVRMIRVKPAGAVEAPVDADGAALFPSGCPSGGTADLLIEPYRPAPRVAVLGRKPVAAAILAQAALMGLRPAASAESGLAGGDGEAFPGTDLAGLALGPRDAAVIACQGEGDLAAAEAALGSAAGFVAMIASARKAGVLREGLAARGLPEARIAALRAPAGLSIGAVDPAEIALSVLAEFVAWRRAATPEAPGN